MTKDYRHTEFYKSLNQYLATAYAEGFCEGEGATEQEQLCAYQWLHDTQVGYKLQGSFGRAISSLLERGVIQA